jgi:hypothetical protein
VPEREVQAREVEVVDVKREVAHGPPVFSADLHVDRAGLPVHVEGDALLDRAVEVDDGGVDAGRR